MSEDHVQPASWKGYWKRRKPGDRKPDPLPLCYAHGCERKGPCVCCRCGENCCSDHFNPHGQMCLTCNEEGQREAEDPCPYCGQDECDCHENIVGFPEGCSRD